MNRGPAHNEGFDQAPPVCCTGGAPRCDPTMMNRTPPPSASAGRVPVGLLLIVALVGVVALGFFWTIGIKNEAVAKDEAVVKAWADVEGQYQRRTDLIPNLVETVRGAADFEQDTLTQVTEARASVGQIKLSGESLLDDPAAMEQFMARQQTLGGALSRLLVVAEKYPQLTATQRFGDLQNQLEGTENRIAQARRDFTQSVQDYNTFIRKIPNKWLLDSEEYPRRETFQASAGAEEAPQVDFGGGGG